MQPSDLARSSVVERLLHSDDEAVVLKTRRDLLGQPENTLAGLRRSVANSERARRLLAHRRPMARLPPIRTPSGKGHTGPWCSWP